MVRTLVCWVALVAVVSMAGGCASHKARDREARARGLKVPTDRSVLTRVAASPAKPAAPAPAAIRTVTPAPLPAPAFSAAPQFQPVDPTDYAAPRPAYTSVAPLPAYTPAPFPPPAPLPARYTPRPAAAHFPRAGAAPPAAGLPYQVKSGDTLFGIARTRYGDGKRWQQIAMANPGLTPATLKAGSTIVVP